MTNTGVGRHFLLQGIFPTQESNPGLPHCRQMLYRLSHQGRYYISSGDHLAYDGIVTQQQLKSKYSQLHYILYSQIIIFHRHKHHQKVSISLTFTTSRKKATKLLQATWFGSMYQNQKHSWLLKKNPSIVHSQPSVSTVTLYLWFHICGFNQPQMACCYCC